MIDHRFRPRFASVIRDGLLAQGTIPRLPVVDAVRLKLGFVPCREAARVGLHLSSGVGGLAQAFRRSRAIMRGGCDGMPSDDSVLLVHAPC